jgi:hypothetical protein
VWRGEDEARRRRTHRGDQAGCPGTALVDRFGAVLAFREDIFANPEGLITYINKHPEGARVRPDMKVVFFDEWETAPERLRGATGILRALVGIAERAKAA